MKKIVFVVAAMVMISGAAEAKVRSIVEWDGGENPYKTSDVSVTGEKLESKCSKACEGYSLKIATCPRGKKIVSCETNGCGYYNKCVTSTASEQIVDADEMENIDIDEIYNAIVEEQKAAKEVQNSLD